MARSRVRMVWPSSLRVRVPLIIGALFLAVLGVFLWAGYMEMERTLSQTGGARAQVAADQLAGLLAQATQPRVTELRRLADTAAVRACAQDASAPSCGVARQAFLATSGTGASLITLWTTQGTRAVDAAVAPPRNADAASLAPSITPPTGVGVTPFRTEGALVTYGTVVDILAESTGDSPAGRRLGYLESRRALVGAQASQTSDLLSRLVGTGAVLGVGNRDGTVWTDLAHAVRPPAVNLARVGVAEYTVAEGPRRVGAVATISRTPWSVWVEFPQAVLLAPARAFLERMAVIGLLVVAATAVLLAVISWRLTAPLQQLTAASEAIAAGEYTRRVATHRDDEIGRLGAAFNVMVDHVQTVHRELDGRVQQRTADLEAAVQQLEGFSYSVSHDLRAPLRAITGFSRILLDEHSGELSEDAAKYVQRVAAGALQMGHLVDDLLEFARLGRAPVRRAHVNPGAIVQDLLEDLRGEYGDRDVRVAVTDLPPCEADPALLKQVYANLLSNAFKFSREQHPAVVDIGAQADDGGAVTYFVRDNGAGFDMRYADKLFGVFQRLHRAEDYEGTGVGLAIVQRVVTRHGGRVWAESALNQGACFYFTLGGGGRDAGIH